MDTHIGKNQLLVGAINDSLLSLGEPIMKTIIWHLNAQGIYLHGKKEVDIRIIHNLLEQIIGDIAEVVLNEIYERLKSGVPAPPAHQKEIPTVDMIERLLDLHHGGQSR